MLMQRGVHALRYNFSRGASGKEAGVTRLIPLLLLAWLLFYSAAGSLVVDAVFGPLRESVSFR